MALKAGPKVVATSDVASSEFDSLVVVSGDISLAKSISGELEAALTAHAAVDKTVLKDPTVVSVNGRRVVYSPTGPVNRDFDDVRRFQDAAVKGVKRAIAAGSRAPLLAVIPSVSYPRAPLVALLGALEAVYSPLQHRELHSERAKKVDVLGFYGQNERDAEQTVEIALHLEGGRIVARDLGGGDPERMAPPKFAEYVEETFAGTAIKVQVIADRSVFEKEYPLFAAVDRAANHVPRHQGRIIYLTYEGEGPITKTVMPCGKGITYDTGGADIKAGGIMAGMSRDKCGAAAVAGFFQVLATLKPKGIKAIGGLAVARNSVGEECYVADEIIVSRAGKTIRIGNTDAEGRMVMTDVLCKLKEIALNEVNPHLFTVATLTGHAVLSVGEYTALLDNGPARKERFASEIQRAGAEVGDMIEVSTIRRDDFDFIKKGTCDGEDLLQCNNAASSRTPRGHQFPAAFMIEASGLDKHGIDSDKPLKYSHFDIGGSAGDHPANPTAVPILAWSNFFFGDSL